MCISDKKDLDFLSYELNLDKEETIKLANLIEKTIDNNENNKINLNIKRSSDMIKKSEEKKKEDVVTDSTKQVTIYNVEIPSTIVNCVKVMMCCSIIRTLKSVLKI